SAEEKTQLAELNPQITKLQAEQKQLQEAIAALEAKAKDSPSDERTKTLQQRRQERDALQKKLAPLQERQRQLSHADSHAALDSELTLLWWDSYERGRWQPNLLNFQVPESERQRKPPILMVSRLDGPTAAIAKRLVDQAVEVERKGLSGKV